MLEHGELFQVAEDVFALWVQGFHGAETLGVRLEAVLHDLFEKLRLWGELLVFLEQVQGMV